MKPIKHIIKDISEYITEGIWKVKKKDVGKFRYFFVRYGRMVILAVRNFQKDKCSLKAPALTFYTLLSIVPIVAMLFAIAKGFGFQDLLESELKKSLSGQEEVMDMIIKFANDMLGSAKEGTMIGYGVILLLWSVIQLLSSVENAFNDIWKAKMSRAWVRKFTDYLSIMLIAPIFIILSSGVMVLIETHVKQIFTDIAIISFMKPIAMFGIKLIPYVLMWFLFGIIYMIMPNTKVNFRSAMTAGFLAGSMFQLTLWGYMYFQVGVSRYNAIYGSFAALPLFLILMHLGWQIVLFGAEIANAHKSAQKFRNINNSIRLNNFTKTAYILLVLREVVVNFLDRKKLLSKLELRNRLDISEAVVDLAISKLHSAKLIYSVYDEKNNCDTYIPGEDANNIDIINVISSLEDFGKNTIENPDNSNLIYIIDRLKSYRKQLSESKTNVLVKNIK